MSYGIQRDNFCRHTISLRPKTSRRNVADAAVPPIKLKMTHGLSNYWQTFIFVVAH